MHLPDGLRAPHGEFAWRAGGRAFEWNNLPPLPERGNVRRARHLRWLQHGSAQLASSPARVLHGVASLFGQWSEEDYPQTEAWTSVRSRIRAASGKLSYRSNPRMAVTGFASYFDGLLSDWAIPPGLASLIARRGSPDYFKPAIGFPGLAARKRASVSGGGYTQETGFGRFEFTMGLMRARINAQTIARSSQPVVDFEAGLLGGAPPLAGEESRRLLHLRGLLGSRSIASGKLARHRIAIGTEWEDGSLDSLLTVPGNLHLIAARGQPALLVQFLGPGAALLERQSAALWAKEMVELIGTRTRLELELSAVSQNGRVARTKKAMVRWNTLSARFALGLNLNSRLAWHATFARVPAALSDHVLHYGAPDSLSGHQYLWDDHNEDMLWQPGETSTMTGRFGGRYSRIAPELRAPVIRELRLGTTGQINQQLYFRLELYRADEWNRILAINEGVPETAFVPVQVLDPGPDGTSRTFDDLQVTVWAQDPSSLGRDSFVLVNRTRLATLNKGLVAVLESRGRQLYWRVSFMAVKTYGPTNPGNSLWENDSGTIGALGMDPNTWIHAAGRNYFDRAYVAKLVTRAQLPAKLSGLEVLSTAAYFDGLPFGRRLLVEGLPQGPFLVNATPRGSPEGGHRTEYTLGWNVRLARQFTAGVWKLRPAVEVLNALNTRRKLREMDVTGPEFMRRLPLEIQPPRSMRLELALTF